MHKEKYMANSVIERGYGIYDEWNNRKYNSRKIVNCVRFAVASMYAERTHSTRMQALSYLFALDMRVKERYSDVIRCIFSYFAWRRETALLKWLKGQFNTSQTNDVRDVIEIELKNIREKIDLNKVDDTDKKAQGGKSVGITSDDYAVNSGEQQYEMNADETAQGRFEADERAEDAEAIVNELIDEQVAENVEKQTEHQKTVEKSEKTTQSLSTDEKENNGQEPIYENKTENNGVENESKPITDKIKENKTYNDATDIPPIYEEQKQVEKSYENSFIDEVIMDNIIKGKADVIGHNPMADVKQNATEDKVHEIEISKPENNKNDKDSYLYDKMIANIKGDSLRGAVNTLSGKTENTSGNSTNAESKPEENRVQIKVDASLDAENAFRKSINDKFTDKMILIHKSLMENALREELIIASAELGIDDPVKIMGETIVSDANKTERFSVGK